MKRPYSTATMPADELILRYAAYGLVTTYAEQILADTGTELRERQGTPHAIYAGAYGATARIIDDLTDALDTDTPNLITLRALITAATDALAATAEQVWQTEKTRYTALWGRKETR